MPAGGGGMVRRDRGMLENEVLAALGAAGRPLTPGEVLAELDDGLAYTTVLTTLSRLHAKGALSRQRSGRAHAYAVAADRSALTARQMRRLLDTGADRSRVLSRFLDELPIEDRPLLRDLLREIDGG